MGNALKKELNLLEGESYVNPLAELRPRPDIGGYGLFANQNIPINSTIIVWACHAFVSYDWIQNQPKHIRENAIQLTEDFFTYGAREKADFINHSCNPNCGMIGQIQIVTMANVSQNEELCLDYAMLHAKPICEFPCCCGSPNCRKQVTGEDWKRKELQTRYRGYFCSYVQSQIDGRH